MKRKLSPKKITKRLTHVRRQSPTLHRARWLVTVVLLAALFISVSVWGVVREQRLRHRDGAVQVSVGTSVMAHIVPDELEETGTLDKVLKTYGVRPSSRQQVLLMGEDFSLEITGEDLKEYALEPTRQDVILWHGEEEIGRLQWIVMPGGSKAA